MIIDDFKEIMDKYPSESKKQLTDNEFALKMREDFTKDLEDYVFDLVENNEDYKVKISHGMGTWAKRPWAGILNKNATNTFQEGLYLIYIFDFKNEGIWLSLDQGSENTPLTLLEDVSDYLINMIQKRDIKTPNGFYSDERKIYDETIISKFYKIDQINSFEFKNDLKELIKIYEYLIPYCNEYLEKYEVDLADNFKEIFDNYENEKLKPIKGNKLAIKMRKDFNDNFRNFVSDLVSDEFEYETKISSGMGKWVSSPWADLRYTKVSSSFQNGFYIFTSFDLENKILNMGLIQGKDKVAKDLKITRGNYIYQKACEKFPDIFENVKRDESRINLFALNYVDLTEINLKNNFKQLIQIYESLIPDYIDCVCDEEPLNEDLRPYEDNVRIWRIAPGEKDIVNEVWDEFKKDSYVGVSFERDSHCPDFRQFKNKYAVNNYLYGNLFENKPSTTMLWKFVRWIRKGDIVVVNKGRSKLAGIGVVTGEFIPKCENNNLKDFGLNSIIPVNWILTPDDLEIRKNMFARHTLVEWTDAPEKWNELAFTLSRNDFELRNKLLEYIYSSFWNDFSGDWGENHNERYQKEKEYINQIWSEITLKYQNGENISDDIWDKILNRDIKLHKDGANDVKATVKGKYKYSDEEMVTVARLFFEKINSLLNTNDVDKQKDILSKYDQEDYSREFAANRFSTVIHYLDNSFYVINSKSVETINLLSLVLGDKLEIDTTLKNYISNNVKYKKFLNKLKSVYSYDNFDISNFELFDALCHWINDKKFGNFAGKNCNLIPIELILGDVTDASCNQFYEVYDFPEDFDERAIKILKDLYCHIDEWKEEFSDDGITIDEYETKQSEKISISDLTFLFNDLVNEGFIKLVSENPKKYDLNFDEEEIKYLSIEFRKEFLNTKLQGFKISNYTIYRLCASLNAGKHIILEGTPGTGKTELAIKFSSAAHEHKYIDGFILTTATSDWSTFDTIGGLMPNEDGDLEFKQGKFLEAIESNKWLIIDEINRADIDKAFGQLFTVLSGNDVVVELPYKENGKSVKIKNWDEFYCKHDFDNATYYIGTNWRIIGTMNVDDKDSLFDLSYAFMRRFMFIEVDLPEAKEYKDLIESWATNLDDFYIKNLIALYGIIENDYRKLGPAIFKDMISYIKARVEIDSSNQNQILGEAIDSYILPQLEGLDRTTLNKIEEFFKELELFEFISVKFKDLKLDL